MTRGSWIERWEARFVALNRALIAGLLAIVFAIVLANVAGRHLFGASFAWVEEAARHLMILGVFAGAGLALREGRLVAISALPDMLPPELGRAIRIGVVCAMAVFMAMVLRLGLQFAEFGWNKSTMSTGMPRGVPYLSIPFGAALFLIHLALFARRFIRREFEFADGGA